MKKIACAVIGGGPSGLTATLSLLQAGIDVHLFERSHKLGGQLVKQTHKFFGSKEQYAKTRGFDIAAKLIADLEPYRDHLTVETEATVAALYPDKVFTVTKHEKYWKYQADAIVVATGASEKFLAFENNDLPGVYGAGAVQTLMNLYGVLPAKRIVMIGSGNIGLIVSYQLIQAGVEVAAVLEAAPTIGGYKVHASKLTRLGVPILTQRTIQKAIGRTKVEGIETVALDANWKPIAGSETIIEADAVCVSVGLSPLHMLLSMADVTMKFVPELGGLVPLCDESRMTTLQGVFVAGDVVGIEEASSAIVEGSLTGLFTAMHLGKKHPRHDELVHAYEAQLVNLRSGPFGKKTLVGLAKLKEARHA